MFQLSFKYSTGPKANIFRAASITNNTTKYLLQMLSVLLWQSFGLDKGFIKQRQIVLTHTAARTTFSKLKHKHKKTFQCKWAQVLLEICKYYMCKHTCDSTPLQQLDGEDRQQMLDKANIVVYLGLASTRRRLNMNTNTNTNKHSNR